MSSLEKRIARLSTKQREFLELLMHKRAMAGERPPLLPISQGRETFPLSFAQQRLWFLDQLDPGGCAYIIPAAVSITGPLRISALHRSLQEIINRHPALRTTFTTKDGEPRQIVSSTFHLPLCSIDLRNLRSPVQPEIYTQLLQQELLHPFNLATDLLMRAYIFMPKENEYILLLILHHIAFDGWSMGLLVKEVMELYSAFVAQQTSPLPALSLQYTDFVLWQRQWLQGKVLDQLLNYWTHLLDNAPEILELPTDRPRPAVQSSHGASCAHLLPPTLSQKLQQVSQREGVTLFMLLFAAFIILLYRYSGQEDIVVGSPIANRPHDKLEALIGLFANTLVLRTKLNGNDTVREVLSRINQMATEAYAHQDLPFEQLVEALQPQRDLSHNPLFQVMFVLQNAPQKLPGLPGVTIKLLPVRRLGAQFDLTLTIEQTMNSLQAVAEYSTDLFDESTIIRMLQHYQVLLMALSESLEHRVGNLPLLTENELHQILQGWNATDRVFPDDNCVHHLFAAQVERSPDSIAIVLGDQMITYQSLHQRSNQLARYLRTTGAGIETGVGLYMERSLEMVICLLAILKVGGTYIPIDPMYPQERINFMLQDAEVSCVLTQAHLRQNVPEQITTVICIEQIWDKIERECSDDCPCPITRDHLAYLIYTSGSTGRPKGVQISHRALVNFLSSMQQRPGITPRDILLSVTTLSFDIAGLEIYLPLITGARLHIAEREVITNGEQLRTLLRNAGATIMQATPVTWKLLLEAGWQNTVGFTVLCGGEALPETLKDQLCRPSTILWNLYGPTETTIWSSLHQCRHQDLSTCIGRPIHNTYFYILDSHLQPVPVGVTGDIYIGGVGLSRGYRSQAALTAERFLPDPFSATPGARMYKTGDLAVYQPDGTIVFVGRSDNQVKLRGFRIEIGEIEETLHRHPSVKQAVVLLKEDEIQGQYLAAYITRAQETFPSPHDLQMFLQKVLPHYMIPSHFTFLEAFPLTPNAKIDRQTLLHDKTLHLQLETSFVPPRNGTEETIATIFSQLFARENISVHDHFFELGGHSLLATVLIAKVRDYFRVEIPLRSIFENPTIAELALSVKRLQAQQDEATFLTTKLPPLVPMPDQWFEPFALMEMQQAYWIGRSEAFELGNVATHIYQEIECPDLDLERFNCAWQQLIERHGILRSIVLPEGMMQTLDHVPFYEIAVTDLRGRSSDEIQAYFEDVRNTLSHQVRRPDQWPLFEIRASHLDNGYIRIHMSIDGLLLDGWSYQILFKEWLELYRNPQATLEPLDISFRDYAVADRNLQQTSMYQHSLDYWLQRLPTLPPPPSLPLARQPATLVRPHFTRRSTRLDSTTWQQLKKQASRLGVTPTAVLLTAYANILATWSGDSQFTINVPRFNRLPLHPQVEDLLGQFASFTLLAINAPAHQPFALQVQHIQEQIWQDLDHQVVSGVRLLRELVQRQGRSPRAIMPVVFTSAPRKDKSGSPSALSNTVGKVVYSITQTSQVWLDNQVVEEGETLMIDWDAVEDLFPDGLLDDMFSAYCHYLKDLAWNERSWNETSLQLIPASQLAQRTHTQTDEQPFPSEPVHTLFTRQVLERQEQAAIITSQRVITYQELYNRACHLAHQLRSRGACPNSLVAVFMEKGWEQVVAVLGTLYAGAAYLPLDVELPQERLHYMLQHSKVNIVLTQAHIKNKLFGSEQNYHLLEVDEFCLDHSAQLDVVQCSDDLAYVIFTSGSTGLPKGVMIAHRGLVNAVVETNRHFHVTAKDRILALTALHHDMSAYDIFGTLAAGGTIVLPDSEKRRDPEHWLQLMRQHQVTIWNSVPSMMEMLLTYVIECGQSITETLRLAFLGGDWISVTLPDRLRSLAKQVQLVSVGGPTETTLWNIWYPVETVDPQWRSIPYGRPIAHTRYYILNDFLEHCPNWVPGQMYCTGVGLAHGYLYDEERTRESFFDHPLTGERLYRTGDYGRYLPNGVIEFLGRKDFQVKIQGQRIEIGEIEHTLSLHPMVDTCAVVVSEPEEENKQKKLVAHVVLKSHATENQPEKDDFFLTVYDQQREENVLLDQRARIEFKLRQKNIHTFEQASQHISLRRQERTDEREQLYLRRRSYRLFSHEKISFDDFSNFLDCLSQFKFDDFPLPKYRYPSGGGLYPVQAYLYVKPDCIENIPCGTYYYHPQEHALVSLSSNIQLDHSFQPPNNYGVFDACAFSLFLIADLDSIAPLYGSLATELCILEAGYIGQLLMMVASDHHIGLCPVGRLNFDQIQQHFQLSKQHLFLHSLLGGNIDIHQPKAHPSLNENRAFFASTEISEPLISENALIHDLRSFLKRKLPSHMVPSLFVLRSTLPLNPNGKVDRKALLSQAHLSLEHAYSFVPPQNETERTIAEIWLEVLSLTSVGIHDNLFDIGGNSMHIIQIHNKLRKKINQSIPIIYLFEYPTISALSAALTTKNNDNQEHQKSLQRARMRRDLHMRQREMRSSDDPNK